MKLLYFVLILAPLIGAEKNWEKFKVAHSKDYDHPVVNALRKELFLKLDAKIKQHNSENHSWKMGHNFLSDLTEEEKQNYLGAVEPSEEDVKADRTTTDDSSRLILDRQSLPPSLDYRNDPCMAFVKDQRRCGSCWAFAATNPLEFANCKKKQRLTPLSEQHLVDCVYGTTRSGCAGGWQGTAYSYLLATNTGSPALSIYGYTAKWVNGSCNYNPRTKSAQLLSFARVPSSLKLAARVEMMQTALIQNSTLSVSIVVEGNWSSYASGVFSNTTICHKAVNHAVVVVGYGTENDIDYWIVRNSWGPKWGNKGYILMKRGVNQCRIEDFVTYVSAY